VLALAAAAAPVVVASMDGWWDMPRGEFARVMGSVDAAVAADPSRVLWVGDPAELPGGPAWELDGGVSYTATEHATPGVADLWPATGLGASERLGEAVRLAVDGQTSRLGRVLAPMGVQYVAVPRALAPASALERSGREDDDGEVGADDPARGRLPRLPAPGVDHDVEGTTAQSRDPAVAAGLHDRLGGEAGAGRHQGGYPVGHDRRALPDRGPRCVEGRLPAQVTTGLNQPRTRGHPGEQVQRAP
jgi:hypothetical protein